MIKKSRKTKQSKKIVKQSINSNKKNKIGNKQQKLPKRTRKSSNEQSTEQQETNITVEQKKSQEDRHYCTNPALLQELAIWKETANTCCHCGSKNRRPNDRKTIWKCPKCGIENDKMQSDSELDSKSEAFKTLYASKYEKQNYSNSMSSNYMRNSLDRYITDNNKTRKSDEYKNTYKEYTNNNASISYEYTNNGVMSQEQGIISGDNYKKDNTTTIFDKKSENRANEVINEIKQDHSSAS